MSSFLLHSHSDSQLMLELYVYDKYTSACEEDAPSVKEDNTTQHGAKVADGWAGALLQHYKMQHTEIPKNNLSSIKL